MSCVFAILFSPALRMAVMSSEGHSIYYRTHYTPEGNFFPEPPPHLGIHMSPSKMSIYGTHVVAYCSVVNSLEEILNIIGHGLTEVKHSPENIVKKIWRSRD
ncbi:BgTH12-02263 [Blumeria graminis f. sp. triticale]|uniref:BgTH12-02263 n=1 Tax=Blumeria graminis f. sp. triticale TaxID=1689686 RepID=A0A9W4D641_BLUGR|nr:BgTH12-02263 [Blumeria graminis f. sp. triticale]